MSHLLDTMLTPSQWGDCAEADQRQMQALAHYSAQAALIATPAQKKALIVGKIADALRIAQANLAVFEPEFAGIVEHLLLRAKALAEGMYERGDHAAD